MASLNYGSKKETLEMIKRELAALEEKYPSPQLIRLKGEALDLLELIWWDVEDHEVIYHASNPDEFDDRFTWLLDSYIGYIKDPAAYVEPEEPDYNPDDEPEYDPDNDPEYLTDYE